MTGRLLPHRNCLQEPTRGLNGLDWTGSEVISNPFHWDLGNLVLAYEYKDVDNKSWSRIEWICSNLLSTSYVNYELLQLRRRDAEEYENRPTTRNLAQFGQKYKDIKSFCKTSTTRAWNHSLAIRIRKSLYLMSDRGLRRARLLQLKTVFFAALQGRLAFASASA